MLKFCLGLASCALAMMLSAQNISNRVIPSLGGDLISSTNQITFTIGESFIPTLIADENMITQGFQQPEISYNLSLQDPSSLESLKAYVEQGTAKLLWGTTLPTAKTGSFTLERLNNESGNYDIIETRPFSSEKAVLSEYDFTDNDPQDGENVYRIKQIVPNQPPHISDTRKLNFNAVEMVSLFPNPTVGSVNLDLSSYSGRGADISIFSYSGQLMLQQKIQTIGEQSVKILLNNLESGQYQIRINVVDKKNPIVKSIMISK